MVLQIHSACQYDSRRKDLHCARLQMAQTNRRSRPAGQMAATVILWLPAFTQSVLCFVSRTSMWGCSIDQNSFSIISFGSNDYENKTLLLLCVASPPLHLAESEVLLPYSAEVTRSEVQVRNGVMSRLNTASRDMKEPQRHDGRNSWKSTRQETRSVLRSDPGRHYTHYHSRQWRHQSSEHRGQVTVVYKPDWLWEHVEPGRNSRVFPLYTHKLE